MQRLEILLLSRDPKAEAPLRDMWAAPWELAVRAARDLEEARGHVCARRPHLVLVDVAAGGPTMLSLLRAEGLLRSTKAIVIGDVEKPATMQHAWLARAGAVAPRPSRSGNVTHLVRVVTDYADAHVAPGVV